MDETYIFIQGQDETEIFVKKSTVTSVRFDLAKSTAVIATDNDEHYIVVGVLAVNQLYDHFYQNAKLKLFRDKR